MLKGYRIVARRYRTKLGEIDLIARRGDLVLIVEVKARPTLIAAMEAIARESERRIEGAADLWLSRQRDYGSCRCASTWWPCCPGAGRCMSKMSFTGATKKRCLRRASAGQKVWPLCKQGEEYVP